MTKEEYRQIIKDSSTASIFSRILKCNKRPKKKFPKAFFSVLVDEVISRKKDITSEDKESLLLGLIEDNIRHKEVLHFYIHFFIGYRIPNKASCKGHTSPFEFLCDMFFQKVKNAIAFANRTGGKTLCIAILNHLDMTFKKGCEVAAAGSTLAQASKGHKYLKDLHNREAGFLGSHLLSSDPTKSKIFYKNDSMTEIITGTEKGLNSPHSNKLRVDEIDLMDRWDILQEAFSISMSSTDEDNVIMSQQAFSCITSDTLIDVPRDLSKDDRGISVLKLKKRSDKGEKLFVYCFDLDNQKFILKPILNIWKTKRVKVYRVSYRWIDQNGESKEESIKCTEDHLWLLNNGEYKQAKDLRVGESLKSFERKLRGKYHIVSVEYIGVRDVYDIEVVDCNNFVANGVVLHNSTRKYSTGIMQRLLDKANDHIDKFPDVPGQPVFWKIYKWCIWETVEPCARKCKKDPKFGDCIAYSKCGGKAHKGGGWYPIDDFITKIATMDTDTWNTQWLNKKPTGTVFVYGDYWDKDVHFIPRMEPEGEIWHVGGIDFGVSSGHDMVFQGYQVQVDKFKREVEESDPGDIIRSKMKFFLDYEYRNTGRLTIEQLAMRIKEWKYWREGIPIFADPSAAQEKIELEGYGVFTENAINAVESGISLVRSHLQLLNNEAFFYIFHDYLLCEDPNTIATTGEFERYRFNRTKDGMPNTKDPVKAYDHGMDVVRYVIQSTIPYFRDLFMIMWEEIDEGEGFQFDF